MDFGKVENLEQVGFSLPPDHPATALVLRRGNEVGASLRAHIGCPTWTNKAWLGSYYPAGATSKELLPLYARQFNAIGLNTTHYRTPDATTVRRWRESVPPGFRFCPKMPQEISHHRLLQHAERETEAFCEAVASLGEHLGPCFLQLPPHFGPGQADGLEEFLLRFPREVPLAVEFRHPDWFGEAAEAQEGFAVLEALQVSVVLTDVAGRRDALHQRLTTSVAFIRFVGNSLHPSDFTRLTDWSLRLREWATAGLRDLYFFVHQPDITHSPPLSQYLVRQLNEQCGLQLKPCQPIPQPVQGRLFE